MYILFRAQSFIRTLYHCAVPRRKVLKLLEESAQDGPDNIVFLDVWRKS